jgi:hypothetical protein
LREIHQAGVNAARTDAIRDEPHEGHADNEEQQRRQASPQEQAEPESSRETGVMV